MEETSQQSSTGPYHPYIKAAGGGNIMMWGCFQRQELKLVTVKGNMNAAMFRDTLNWYSQPMFFIFHLQEF